MNDGVSTEAAVEAGMKTMSTSNLIGHIVERRLEYLIGTLIAYQMGLLDNLVAAGSQCIA
jgi:hypothetical protein